MSLDRKKPIKRNKINLEETKYKSSSDEESETDFLYIPHVTQDKIESIIGNVMNINIDNIELYQRALVHKSIQKYIKKAKNPEKVQNYLKESNEVLELVGDGVIGLVVITYLTKKYKNKNEGEFTKIRTRIVRSSTLAFFAEKIGIKGNILMSEQVHKLNGDKNKRFLEDAFEAFVGAIYFDKGFNVAYEFITKIIELYLDEDTILKDDNYKDLLLRYAQFSGIKLPEYNIIKEEGKPSNRMFTMEVKLFGERQGKGRSKKKKEAEQLAAYAAIQKLGITNNFSK